MHHSPFRSPDQPRPDLCPGSGTKRSSHRTTRPVSTPQKKQMSPAAFARDVVKLIEPLNIFDDVSIDARRVDKAESDASLADTIAHQLTRSIEEKWDEDPTFFEKFSKLIRDTIAEFHRGRINDLVYLGKAELGVLNEGIIGNRLLNDSPVEAAGGRFGSVLGQAGLTRFDRDVLAQSGPRPQLRLRHFRR